MRFQEPGCRSAAALHYEKGAGRTFLRLMGGPDEVSRVKLAVDWRALRGKDPYHWLDDADAYFSSTGEDRL